jgi:hypothetical protein
VRSCKEFGVPGHGVAGRKDFDATDFHVGVFFAQRSPDHIDRELDGRCSLNKLTPMDLLQMVALKGHDSCNAGQLPFAVPEDVGMDAVKLRGIEQVVGECLDLMEITGDVALVFCKGAIVHLQAHGWRDIESQTPMTSDTIFRVYSMTKPIVSTAVMTMISTGITVDSSITFVIGVLCVTFWSECFSKEA